MSQAVEANMPVGSLGVERTMSDKIALTPPGRVPLPRATRSRLPSIDELPIPPADRALIARFTDKATQTALHRLSHELSQGHGEGALMNLARAESTARREKIKQCLGDLERRHTVPVPDPAHPIAPPEPVVHGFDQALQALKKMHDASASTAAAAGSQGRGLPM